MEGRANLLRIRAEGRGRKGCSLLGAVLGTVHWLPDAPVGQEQNNPRKKMD